MRDVDDEAARQRDLGGEPRALRLHRILDGLDEDRLAALDQVLDLAGAAAALELGADDLVDVEEAVLLEADLDERGLHARQDVVDGAEVDVAGDRAVLGPLEVDLGDEVVLEDGDALLARVDRDEQLALGLRQRRAAGSGAARRRAVPLRSADAPSGLSAFSGFSGLPRRPSRAARAWERRRRSLLRRRYRAGCGGASCGHDHRGCRGGAFSCCVDCPSAAGSSAAAQSRRWFRFDGGAAAADGACSSSFLRRNQDSGKADLLESARAQPRMSGRASQMDVESLGMACPQGSRRFEGFAASGCRAGGRDRARLGARRSRCWRRAQAHGSISA